MTNNQTEEKTFKAAWQKLENSKQLPSRIRNLIKDLENGNKMPQPQQVAGEAVRTNGQDTVLNIPKNDIDDRKFLRSIGSEIMQMQFDAEKMPLKKRDNYIIDKLANMEKNISK